MKLCDLTVGDLFFVPGSKKYRGLWRVCRIYGDGLVAVRKAPYYDKFRLMDDKTNVMLFEECLYDS